MLGSATPPPPDAPAPELQAVEARRLVELFSDPALLVAADGTILAAGSALAAALGERAGSLVGRPLVGMVDEDPAHVTRYLARCTGMLHPLPGALTLRVGERRIACRSDGVRIADGEAPALLLLRLRPKASAVSPFRLLDEKLAELTRQVAAREKAERELRRLNETLEQRVSAEVLRRQQAEEVLHQAQRMEAIGHLTGGIAHDFNNLLTVIVGALTLLQARVADPVLRRYVDAAVRSAERAGKLTDHLLAFARRQMLRPEVVDVNALVADTVELLRTALGRAIEVELRLAADAAPAFCDPNQLQTVLLNLALNARDAMPNGGRLTIETENRRLEAPADAPDGHAAAPGDYVVLRLADNGKGIPPEIVGRVFEPFFTTKEVGKGTGLGLAQVYGFARQSGGFVRLESAVGEGTTVEVSLRRSV
jgi:signal transduction histidine kinase